MNAQATKTIARKLQLRSKVEHAADSARLLVDSFSDPVYQPVPELGRRYVSANRSAGTTSRWGAMRPVIEGVHAETAADIGCNAGWFTLELARLGLATVGIEAHPPYYRAAITALQRSGLRNAGVMVLELTPATLGLLAPVDCVVFLSVWHHIVHEDGLEGASSFLRGLWERTNKVLFFETGESEEFRSSGFGLPEMEPDPKLWIGEYLSQTCEGAEVKWLGTHPSSGPEAAVSRNLFAVRRTRQDSESRRKD
jgi:2-polyprenyl-3-methyl-5-hydroxy-6-metoxy-1,4-benzoquinol methylase